MIKKGGLIFGSTRVISYEQERLAVDKERLLIFEFMTAYTNLRSSCSKGDLHIHVYVQGSAEDVGAQFDDEEQTAPFDGLG